MEGEVKGLLEKAKAQRAIDAQTEETQKSAAVGGMKER
jgi:hypothetical protein